MKNLNSFTISIFLLIFGLSAAVNAQAPDNDQTRQKKQEYLALVEKLKKGVPDVNFGQLRRAFVEWRISGGKPEEHPKRAEMVKAFGSNNHAEAVKLAEEVLDMEFYNHNIHGAVSDSYKALNNTEKSEYYNDLFHKAQHGLFLSGDGRSPETAYYVLSIPEEYRVMRELGLTVTVQSLLRVKGQAFDVLSGKDAKGNEVSVYFNICFFFPCQRL
ncbi:MAG TPA: DUF4919 domain-containing protein [Pyrinomonadaceae bacterium]|nr:DUF4919 domain-containing protein [Pyrinomonadaceae bacterium]HMP66267.1 DUF4919 domain-containing protein [Pyrinomonadaceae bacterium]